MGYPYSWQNDNTNSGIKGPSPMIIEESREADKVGTVMQTSFTSGITSGDYKNHIRASIQRILMTDYGERVMEPNFGCDIKRYVFDPSNRISEAEIKHEIMRAISRWEPRVSISNISLISKDERLIISVPYTIKGTGEEDSVNYVFRLKKNIDDE